MLTSIDNEFDRRDNMMEKSCLDGTVSQNVNTK